MHEGVPVAKSVVLFRQCGIQAHVQGVPGGEAARHEGDGARLHPRWFLVAKGLGAV